MLILLTAAFALLPAGVIYLTHHQRWAQRLGVIVICYGLGIALGLGGVIPDSAMQVPTLLSELTIVFALPLLMFSLDLRQLSRVAGKALLSMLFAMVAVTGLATCLYFLYRDGGVASANLAAMSVGVYSGGTPNLAAIKAGLEIPNAQYLAFHSLDAVVGSLYFLFMLTVGVPLFRALLPGSAGALARAGTDESDPGQPVDEDDYSPFMQLANLGQVAAAVLLSALVVALSFGIAEGVAWLTGSARNSAVLIIALTTLGLAFSLHPRVRGLTLAYRTGMYLVCVFCLAVSTQVRLAELLQMDTAVAVFLFVVVFGGLSLHALLCRLARVDGDTFMITSVAAVTSPPFVPLMARALNNPAAMLPGMTVGVIGYALGSYLGISLGLYLGGLSAP